ncbi:hypothetical protein [Ekhidna sp.]
MRSFYLLSLIAVSFLSHGQSTYLERSSPQAAAAQLFFFDRTSNGVTERNWKIATLPPSTNATGDKIMIELFGGSHGSSSTFQQVIHMGNRGGFNGYLRSSYGEPYASVRVRAYQQADGSIDVFLSLLSNGWKGGSVRIYEGSGIVASRPSIYENPINIGANPAGTLVFDSYTATPGLVIKNDGKVIIGSQPSPRFDNSLSSYVLESSHFYGHTNSQIMYVGEAGNTVSVRGKLGIGTTSPDDKLTVQGNLNVGGTTNGTIKARHLTGKSHTSSDYGDLYLQYHTTHPVRIGTSTNPAPLFVQGNVGIGTSDPDSKLTVAGNIHAQEVKVTIDAGTGPDYVFEPDYDLRSLEETEAYIQANKHLPEVPSASEMEANGVQLGEMNMLLLKKVEELTLYLIQNNKEKEELNQQLKANSQSQQKMIEELTLHLIKQQAINKELILRLEKLEK